MRLEDDQFYSVREKRVLRTMEEREALGYRRAVAFIPATQRKGQPMTYGSGKPQERD